MADTVAAPELLFLIKDLCAQLGLKNTCLIGAKGQDQLAEMYTVADLGCFPSFKEPVGLVFVECMACKTPVIGANPGGPKDFDLKRQAHLPQPRRSCDACGPRAQALESWEALVEVNSSLTKLRLVAKPDQLIKRRGKAGLIAVNKGFEGAKAWVMERMCKEQKVEAVTGQLTNSLIELLEDHS